MTILNIFVLLLLVEVVFSAKFPSNWTKCPKINNEQCLKESIAKVLLELKNGRKDVGIVPIDPLYFDRMEMNQGSSSPVNINLTFTDLDFIGASKVRLTDVKIDWDTHNIFITGDYPGKSVGLIGDYTVNGKILVLPIQGQGKCNITMESPTVEVTLEGKELIKNGKKYMDIVKGVVMVKPGRTHFWFGNLFEGVPNLGDNMNKFLNDNWREVTKEINSTLANAIGLGAKGVANEFFHRVPVDELYA